MNTTAAMCPLAAVNEHKGSRVLNRQSSGFIEAVAVEIDARIRPTGTEVSLSVSGPS